MSTATTTVITTARAKAARDLLDYRQRAYDRSPTEERREAWEAAIREYRAALRAQEPRRCAPTTGARS